MTLGKRTIFQIIDDFGGGMTSPALVKHFSANPVGRDFAVGDIHGHFTLLQEALNRAGFDPARDRLFSVGDLIDRGPECEQALAWLDKPWFHPVRGNHDDYVCRHDTCDIGSWLQNGGAWFMGLTWAEKCEFAARFRELPITIQVETPNGPIGLVHADCPFPSWLVLISALEADLPPKQLRAIKTYCLWSRRRIEEEDTREVEDIRAVVAGHTPLALPTALGNVYHIDTMGWRPQDGGYFTLLDLHSLTAVPNFSLK